MARSLSCQPKQCGPEWLAWFAWLASLAVALRERRVVAGSVLVLLLQAGAVGVGLAQPTFTDQFGAGTPLIGVTTGFGSNIGATAQVGEPAHSGEPARASVWARWTADVTATYTITTSNSTFDTVLAVYLGTALNNLKVIVTNDDVDFRTFTSVVQFRAYAGETFHIAVDGVNGAQGQVELHVVSGGPAMSAWNTTSARGVPIQSSDFPYPVMLVDFWETTCGACVEELQDLVLLQRTLAPRGFSIVGLSIDLNPADVVRFLDIHDDITYPMMMSSPSASNALLGGAAGVPTKYLVDQDRRIIARFLGGHVPVSETFSFYMSQIAPILRSSSIMQLQIERQTNSVRVSWPDSDLTYRLEASSTPLTGWLPASGPAQTNSGRKIVTLPADGTGNFFRLIKP